MTCSMASGVNACRVSADPTPALCPTPEPQCWPSNHPQPLEAHSGLAKETPISPTLLPKLSFTFPKSFLCTHSPSSLSCQSTQTTLSSPLLHSPLCALPACGDPGLVLAPLTLNTGNNAPDHPSPASSDPSVPCSDDNGWLLNIYSRPGTWLCTFQAFPHLILSMTP